MKSDPVTPDHRPAALRFGDTIGIFSPSYPYAARYPRRYARAVMELEARGFTVREARSARAETGHTAGSAEERLEDLHSLVCDSEVRALIAVVGGFNSNQLLEHLNYELVAHYPKIWMGYSDVTSLLVAVWKRTRLTTFLGPMVLTQFGEPGGLHPYTWHWMQQVLMRPQTAGELHPSPEWFRERLEWDLEDSRPRRGEANPGPTAIRSGSAEGSLIAGEASTLLSLAGTEFWPSFSGSILCIEDSTPSNPATIDRYLFQLRHIGVFGAISGLVIGRFRPGVNFATNNSLKDIVLRATRGTAFPIVSGLDFGHTDPMLTLPLGIRSRLQVSPEGVGLTLLDASVS